MNQTNAEKGVRDDRAPRGPTVKLDAATVDRLVDQIAYAVEISDGQWSRAVQLGIDAKNALHDGRYDQAVKALQTAHSITEPFGPPVPFGDAAAQLQNALVAARWQNSQENPIRLSPEQHAAVNDTINYAIEMTEQTWSRAGALGRDAITHLQEGRYNDALHALRQAAQHTHAFGPPRPFGEALEQLQNTLVATRQVTMEVPLAASNQRDVSLAEGSTVARDAVVELLKTQWERLRDQADRLAGEVYRSPNEINTSTYQELREASKTAHFHYLQAGGAPVMQADRSTREAYTGIVVGNDAKHVVQFDAGQQRYVVHEARAISGDTRALNGKEMAITYPFGGAGIARPATQAGEIGRDQAARQNSRSGAQFGERER